MNLQSFDIRIHRHNDPVKEIKKQTLPATQKIVQDRDYSRIEIHDSDTGVSVSPKEIGPAKAGEQHAIDHGNIREGPPVE